MSWAACSLRGGDEGHDDHEESLIFGVDYTRNRTNKYPQVHMHVVGERSDLDEACIREDRKSINLRRLHLPVGEKRFRPTLEDVVEFAILEGFAHARPGWESAIESGRQAWRERQTKALVRSHQDWAAEVLDREGWDVKPPPDRNT